jgi:hypothetical protein
MLAFSRAILLMCVWTQDMMGYADVLKKIAKFVVLNMSLEIKNFL